MPSPTVTVNTTDTQHVFGATIMDSQNKPLTGETGDGYTWTADDGGTLVSLSPNVENVTVHIKGQAGTVNLSVAASKPGATTVNGLIPIVIQGPVRDHVEIAMLS